MKKKAFQSDDETIFKLGLMPLHNNSHFACITAMEEQEETGEIHEKVIIIIF
jgi:hypothetical protein